MSPTLKPPRAIQIMKDGLKPLSLIWMANSSIDESMITSNEAIILSMTKEERQNPKIISGSRRKRISKGAGVDVAKINKLLKQFRMMFEMMKKMSKGKKIPSGKIPDEILNQLKWKEQNVKNKTINGWS